MFFSIRNTVQVLPFHRKENKEGGSVFWSWFWYFWVKKVSSVRDQSMGHLSQMILAPLWEEVLLESLPGRHIVVAGGDLLKRRHGYLNTIVVINNAAIKLNIQRK